MKTLRLLRQTAGIISLALCLLAAEILAQIYSWSGFVTLVLTLLWVLVLYPPLFPGACSLRGTGLPPAADDLPRRRPVWDVLSDLYLDTELGDTDLDHAAKVLAESGYNSGQLEEILYVELHPVLIGNLRCVAGEWAGFDQRWLEQQILKAKPRRGPFAIVLGKWMVRDGWQRIEARIREAGRPR